MSQNVWQKLWVQILIVALFIFAVYSNVGAIVQNYRISQKVAAEQNTVNQMTQDNQQLSLLLNYYASPSYQDVEARSRLGMKQPDETAFVVNGVTFPDSLASDSNIESSVEQPVSIASTESNFSKWLDYFSGK